MAKVTKKDVVAALQAEDYAKAKKLGVASIRHLKAIVSGDDWHLAAKAAYLAGLINVDESVEIIETAARSRKPALRVAAASAAGQLSADRAEPVLERLLRSRDTGIRKCALRAVQSATPKLRKRLDAIRKDDEETSLRKLAREALKK